MSVYRSRVASSRGACAHRAFRIHHGTPGVNERFAVSQGQMHKSPAHGGVPAILLSRLCAGALPDTGRTQEKTAHPPLRSFPICKSAQHGVTPDVRFTTWDDYAIMAMVECGLGVSLLPELILRRVPYRIAIRKFDTPLCRDLALALPGQAHISAATRQFLRYLDRRDAPAVPAGSTGFDNRP